MIQRYIHRHQPQPVWRAIPVAGIGAFLGILILGAITTYGQITLLVAPFGASAVLLFAAHSSPLSQPINVIGGHLVAGIIGVACHFILPGNFVMAAFAMGFCLMVMMYLRVTHPPAGATVLVAYTTATSWMFLLFPVLLGSIIIVGLGILYHQLTDNHYPLALPHKKV